MDPILKRIGDVTIERVVSQKPDLGISGTETPQVLDDDSETDFSMSGEELSDDEVTDIDGVEPGEIVSKRAESLLSLDQDVNITPVPNIPSTSSEVFPSTSKRPGTDSSDHSSKKPKLACIEIDPSDHEDKPDPDDHPIEDLTGDEYETSDTECEDDKKSKPVVDIVKTDLIEQLGIPFDDEITEPKPIAKIDSPDFKSSLDTADYDYDITEKLREMGEISVQPVKKGEVPSRKQSLDEPESEISVTKKSSSNDSEEEKISAERKIGNLRRNIREVMDETKLDEATLAAQREEMERLRRVQEQQKIIREVQRQMALNKQNSKTQHRVISLLQGGTTSITKPGSSMASSSMSSLQLPPNARNSNTVLLKMPNGETKPVSRMPKGPSVLEMIRTQKSINLQQYSTGKSLLQPHPSQMQMQQSIQQPPRGFIPTKCQITPSVSIAPVAKKPPTPPIGLEIEAAPPKPPSPLKKDVETIDVSDSDDDCIVLSEDDEPEPEPDEDPCNSGMHTNDAYNVPDEQGRVLINVGHPENEEDIFLAPQLSRIIKPHQIGGVRFLFDNVIESTDRFSTSTGFGCILAHSMGLGKTLQIVCFSDIFLRHTPAKTILCIMPINTLQNWVAEFNMWLPVDATTSPLRAQGEVRPRNFNLHVLNDSHKSLVARARIIQEWNRDGGVLLIGYELYRLLSLKRNSRARKKKKVNEVVDLDEDDKTKTMFDEIHAALVKPGPDLVICDEGHRIKNSHASISQALKQIRSKRRVVLTGYPLQNNLLEYWCMVDFVRPNYLGTKTEFSNMFERPIQNGQCVDSTPQDVRLMRFRAHVLHSLLEGFVQRRSHAVLQVTLPQKSEYVMLVRMNHFQRKLYDTFMNDVVRTKTVPNPLKAFAVCCKIWNHPDVLYYFLKKRDESDAVDIDLEEVAGVASTPGSNPATPGSATAKKSRAKPRTTPKKDNKKGSKTAEVTKPVLETPVVSSSSDTSSSQIAPSSTIASSDSSQTQTSQTFTMNQPNYQSPQQPPNQTTYPPNQPFNQQFPAPTGSTNPPPSTPNPDYYNQNYPPPNNQYNYYPNQNPPPGNYNPTTGNNTNYFPQNYPNYNQNNWQNTSTNWPNTDQNQQTFTGNQSQYPGNSNPSFINQNAYPGNESVNKDNSGFYGTNNQNQYSVQNNSQAQISHGVQMPQAAPSSTNLIPQGPQNSNQGTTGQPGLPPSHQNSMMSAPPTSQGSMGPPPGYNPIKTESYYESPRMIDNNYPPPMIKTEPNTEPQNNTNYYNSNFAPPGTIKIENEAHSNYYYNQNLPPNQNNPSGMGYSVDKPSNAYSPNNQIPNFSDNSSKLTNQPNYPPNFAYGNTEIKQEPGQTNYNSGYNSNYYQSYNAPPSIYNQNTYPVDPTGLGAPGYQNPSVPPWQKADIKNETESKIDIKTEVDEKKDIMKTEIDLKDKQEIVEEIEDEKESEIKEILPTAKLKEDAGINYDWAVELLKGYVPGCIENSAKMEILFCIIRESMALGDRILLFSQSLFTLNLIEEFLQRYQVPGHNEKWGRNSNYYRLDGSTSALEREKLINEFNANPNIHLFMVSTRAGSLGINLVGANRVVVFDASWNPCHDTQAVCRVYRYGQKKPCFVYRLVMDNCLEKKIYDRQINKQGMSDRVVDECNPDAHLSMKDVTNLCWDDEKDSEVCDFSSAKDKYNDVVMQKVLDNHSHLLSKEPFQHESLLVDRKEKKLSQAEKRMAKRSYEMEKQAVNNAARSAAYSYHGGVNTGMMHRGMRFAQDNSMHNKPIASVRPMQAELNSQIVRDGQRRTRWIPAEVWQRQGMTAQEMTLPLDVVIPTNGAERGNIVLKAGQKVLVLKSPKGIYMQLECGKIVAIRTAMKMRGNTGNNTGNNSPGGMKVPPGAGTPKSSDEASSDGSLLKKNINQRQIASPKALPMPLKNNSAVTITPRGSPQKMVKPMSKVNAYVGRMNKFSPGRSPVIPRGSNMCYPTNPTSPQSLQLSPHNKNVQYGKARPFNMMTSATGVAPYEGVNESKASSECSSETESTHRLIDETHIIPSSDDDQQPGEDKDENISDNDVAEINSVPHMKVNESEKYHHMDMTGYRSDHLSNYDTKPDSIGSYNYPTDSNSSMDSQTHSEIYAMKNDSKDYEMVERTRQYPAQTQQLPPTSIKKDIVKPGLQILEVKSLNKSEMINVNTHTFNDPDLVLKPGQSMINRSSIPVLEQKIKPRSTTPKSNLKNYRHNFSSQKVASPKIPGGLPSALHQLEQTTSSIGIGGDDKLSLQKSLDRITSDAPGDANISMMDTSTYNMDFTPKKTQPVLPMNENIELTITPKPKAKPRRNNRAKAVPKIDTKAIPQTIELDSSDNDSPTKFDSSHPLEEHSNRSIPSYPPGTIEPPAGSQPQTNVYDYNYGSHPPMNPAGYYNYNQIQQTPPSTQPVPPTMPYNNMATQPPQYPEMGGGNNMYPAQRNDNDTTITKTGGKANEPTDIRTPSDYPPNDATNHSPEVKAGNPPVLNQAYPGQQTMMPPPPPVNNTVNYGQQGQYPSSSYAAVPYPNNTYQPYQPPPYDQNYSATYSAFHRPEMMPYPPPPEGYPMTTPPPVTNVQHPHPPGPGTSPSVATPPSFTAVRPEYPPPHPPPQYPQSYPQPPPQQGYNYDYNQYGTQYNQYINPPMYPPPTGPAAPNSNQPSS